MRVLLFARAKDIVGADRVEIALPEGATAVELRRALGREFPALAPLLEKSALAVDGEIAAEHKPLPTGAEVAILPPVSGG